MTIDQSTLNKIVYGYLLDAISNENPIPLVTFLVEYLVHQYICQTVGIRLELYHKQSADTIFNVKLILLVKVDNLGRQQICQAVGQSFVLIS